MVGENTETPTPVIVETPKQFIAASETTTTVPPTEKHLKNSTRYIPPDIIRNPDDKTNPYRFSGIVFQKEYTKTEGRYPVYTTHVDPCKAIVATDGKKMSNGNVNSILVHEEREIDRLDAGFAAIENTFLGRNRKYLVFSSTDRVYDSRSNVKDEWRELPLKKYLESHGIIDGKNAVIIINDWIRVLMWKVKPDGSVSVKFDKEYFVVPEKELDRDWQNILLEIRTKLQRYNNLEVAP